MSGETILQIIGYFSTLLVLVSFLMTSVVKLRLINLAGSGIFVVFAFLTKSYPTAIMNIGICAINIYFLIKLFRSKSLTSLLPIDLDSAYLREFLNLYQADIQRYFPDYSPERQENDCAYFVYYDMNPVGLLLGRRQNDGTLDVHVDYTIPKYRDASVGRFLYPRLLGEEGFKALEFRNASPKHEAYLQKVGFREENGVYCLRKTGEAG